MTQLPKMNKYKRLKINNGYGRSRCFQKNKFTMSD